MAPEPAGAAGAPARYRHFLATSLFFALGAGAALGALMLGASTLTWPGLAALPAWPARVAHGHAQVFGFAALFVMGVAYHALPRLKAAPLARPRLTRASYWGETGGVVLIATGAFLPAPLGPALHLAGALALLLGALAFAAVIDGTLAAGAPSTEGVEPWLRAGCAWLVIAASLAVAVGGGVAALQPAMWEAALYGFAASWILGFSRRLLPAFLGFAVAARGRGAVVALYQAAVLAWVASAAAAPWWNLPAARAGAGAALAAATLLAVAHLGLFAPRRASGMAPAGSTRPDAGRDRQAPFVVAAYTWLLVWLVCVPLAAAGAAALGGQTPLPVADFGRHAFTLGFLSQMIVGVAMRIIPLFSGAGLWSARLREATFWLLNGAMLLRGLQVVVAAGGPAALWPWIAVSGPLATAAFVAFTLNLVMTLRGLAAAPAAAR